MFPCWSTLFTSPAFYLYSQHICVIMKIIKSRGMNVLKEVLKCASFDMFGKLKFRLSVNPNSRRTIFLHLCSVKRLLSHVSTSHLEVRCRWPLSSDLTKTSTTKNLFYASFKGF